MMSRIPDIVQFPDIEQFLIWGNAWIFQQLKNF